MRHRHHVHDPDPPSLLIRLTLCGLGLLAAFIAPRPLYAQVPRPPDCADRFAAAAALPQSATMAALDSAMSRLVGCYPETDHARAAMMRRWAASNDSLLVRRVFGWGPHHDSATVHAALEVAASNGASRVARVFAFGALVSALDPSATPRYADLVEVQEGRWCVVGHGSDPLPDRLVIPPSLEAGIRHTAQSTAGDPAAEPAVRSAAYCVLSAWRVRHGLPWVGFMHDPLAHVTVVAECGAFYRLENTGEGTMTVLVDAPGVRPPQPVDVPGRREDGSAGRAVVRVEGAQHVRLLHDGVLLATTRPAAVPCGSE